MDWLWVEGVLSSYKTYRGGIRMKLILLAAVMLLVSCNVKEQMETCTKMCSTSGVQLFTKSGDTPICICQQKALK